MLFLLKFPFAAVVCYSTVSVINDAVIVLLLSQLLFFVIGTVAYTIPIVAAIVIIVVVPVSISDVVQLLLL